MSIDTADPSTAAPVITVRRPVAMAWAAALILLAQLLLRGWAGYRGFFYLDDFAFTGRVARYGFSAHLLFRDYNSHEMPGAFAWVWATTKLWPLQFAPVLTVCLLLQVVLGIVVYRLLINLFGHRLPVLMVFAVYALTPMTLPAFLWWAAALNQLPQQLAMATALLCQVHYLRGGRLRWGLAGVASVGLGLLFSEKTLLAVPLVAAFTYAFAAGGAPLPRLTATWRAHWKVWLGHLVLAVPYAVYYLLAVPVPAHHSTAGHDIADVTGAALSHALAPGLLGGPWTWHLIGFAGAVAGPGRALTWLSCLACLAVVAASIAWSRRAEFGWWLVLGYIAADIALVALSRATIVGTAIGNEYRYFTDVGLVAALGLGLAVLPIQGEFSRGQVQRLQPRTVVRRAAAATMRDWFGWSGAPRPALRAAGAALLVVAYAVSSTVSTVHYDRFWRPNPARTFVAAARDELDRAPRGLVLYDGTVPQQVAWGLLYPYTRYSRFFAPLAHPPAVLQAGHSSDTLALFDDSGRLRLVTILGVKAAPGPTPSCGWRVSGTSAKAVQLQASTGASQGVLRIGYIADHDGVMTVQAGDTQETVPVQAGLHAVYLLVQGATTTVTLQMQTAGTALCTDEVAIGIPVAVPGSRP